MAVWYDFSENIFAINVYDPNFSFFFFDLKPRLDITYEEKKDCCKNLLSFLSLPKVFNYEFNTF